MGAYAYCKKCDGPMLGPWELQTVDLLNALVSEGFVAFCCPNCNEPNHTYNESGLIEELAQRIDEGRKR